MSESDAQPYVIVIAGPNGAGKSTAAPDILRGAMAVTEFVNADVIARGLSAFAPESVAVSAGKLMLRRLDELAAAHVSFAFETTLAGGRELPQPVPTDRRQLGVVQWSQPHRADADCRGRWDPVTTSRRDPLGTDYEGERP